MQCWRMFRAEVGREGAAQLGVKLQYAPNGATLLFCEVVGVKAQE